MPAPRFLLYSDAERNHTCIHHLLNDICFGTTYMCMPIVYNAIN